MIKAAFCDDDLSVLNELHVLMDNYRVERNQEITYTAFHSPLELIAQIEKGMRFDILFLDVLMPGVNGIETAQEIREYDSAMKIIFLTSSAEYAVESYTVNAYFYQLKPIWPEFLPADGFCAQGMRAGAEKKPDPQMQKRDHPDQSGQAYVL